MIHAIYLNDTQTGWTLIGAGESHKLAELNSQLWRPDIDVHDKNIIRSVRCENIEPLEIKDLLGDEIEKLIKEREL